MHAVLKPFRYSEDGVTSRLLGAGDLVEIRADLVPGLVAEKFIGPPAQASAKLAKADDDASKRAASAPPKV